MAHVTCKATLIRCLDPRFVKTTEAWMEKEYGADTYESMSIAGPGKEIADETNDGKCILNNIGKCIKLHKSPEVVIIFHNNCGNYGIENPEEEKEKQFSDAEKCKKRIRSMFPEIKVKNVWAEMNFETKQVNFSDIN
ncbi:MAG: hypothetical protein PHD31_00220 [Candidatus Pacebacteria bacterium]|nr:hypothetical protein [Candidatus Paceibacterota bacterium]